MKKHSLWAGLKPAGLPDETIIGWSCGASQAQPWRWSGPVWAATHLEALCLKFKIASKIQFKINWTLQLFQRVLWNKSSDSLCEKLSLWVLCFWIFWSFWARGEYVRWTIGWVLSVSPIGDGSIMNVYPAVALSGEYNQTCFPAGILKRTHN